MEIIEAREAFHASKFIRLENMLTDRQAELVSNYILQLVREGKSEIDEQCPSSYSLYGRLDFLLYYFKQGFENLTGKKLSPTYSYCRKYNKGEILKPHKDRPSCEYSITITLGHSKEKDWKITMGEEILSLPIGAGCAYKGCEVNHYRGPSPNTWQTQVFLHYVDIEGPYKDWKFDKRERLWIQNYKQSQAD